MRCLLINEKDIQINEQIYERSVRVIDEKGQQLGIMETAAAIDLAADRKLDLVKIAPQASPPVCKIMNYGKFKFDQSKRLKESKKSQKSMTVKEIRISLTINEHDLQTKVKNIIKFLNSGNKVKINIKFKGREMLRANSGINLMDKIQELCADYGTIEKPSKLEGKSMVAIIAPKPQK